MSQFDYLSCTLNMIRHERQRQDLKWGVQNHSIPEWITILAEEFGEAAMEANEFHFRDMTTLRAGKLRNELVQTAAVACAIIEYLDRHIIHELQERERK